MEQAYEHKNDCPRILVICRGASFDESLSPEDIQNAMKQFYAWFERMSDEGKMKSGHQLAPEGKVLSGRKGVTDGPFRNPRKELLVTGSFEQPVLRKR